MLSIIVLLLINFDVLRELISIMFSTLPGRLDFKPVKHLGIEQRKENHFLQRSNVLLETSNRIKCDLWEIYNNSR